MGKGEGRLRAVGEAVSLTGAAAHADGLIRPSSDEAPPRVVFSQWEKDYLRSRFALATAAAWIGASASA